MTPANRVNQKELARLLGVTARTVQNWLERGCLPEPRRINERLMFWTKEQADEIVAVGPWPVGTFLSGGQVHKIDLGQSHAEPEPPATQPAAAKQSRPAPRKAASGSPAKMPTRRVKTGQKPKKGGKK